MDFQVLLDAPAAPATRIQVAALGDFKDNRYGEFSITRQDVEAWKANLAHLPGQRALIDLDHSADRTPRKTEAAGWITDVDWENDTPVAQVEWTPVGQQAIKDKRYLFFSPTYGDHKDEHGNVHENTLIGGALTNRPFLSSMPALTLASEETLQAAVTSIEETSHLRLLDALTSKQRDNLNTTDFAIPSQRAYPIHDLSHARNALARVAQHGTSDEQAQVRNAVYKRYPQLKSDGSDSRRTMATELHTLLDIAEDADEAKILEAVIALKEKADKPVEPAPEAETRTLDQQARDQGKRLLDAEHFNKLVSDATAGRQAANELHETRRSQVWQRALDQLVRVPAQEDSFVKLYELDAQAAVAAIEDDITNDRRLLNAKPQGGAGAQDTGPKTFDQRVNELAKELDGDYEKAYLKALDETEAGS